MEGQSICSATTNTKQISEMFDVVNKHFYEGVLQKPEITITVIRRRISKSRYASRVYKNVNQKSVSEIAIDASYTFLGNEKNVFREVLECAMYQYCDENGIKVSSRGGTYKNKRFKKVAEDHGLVCDIHKEYGHCIIGLSKEAEKLFERYNWAFLTQREYYTYRDGDTCKQVTVRYFCPKCNTTLRSHVKSRNLNIICGDCGERFERVVCHG